MVEVAALLLLSRSLLACALSVILWAALVCLAFSGFFEMVYLTTNQTLLQLSIPDDLRGRVTGVVSLNSGLMPVGALAAGVGADVFGPQAVTLLLSAVAALIAVGVFLFSPIVREHRLSAAMNGAEEAAV